MTHDAHLDARSIEQRRQIIRCMHGSGRGHLPSALSILEICRVLYEDILRINPHEPDWEDRDRFILSKGHGCLALYLQLAERGFFSHEELWRVSHDGAMLGGHPEGARVPGVECSSGSLGHGVSFGVGLAVGARITRRPTRVFVVVGDGECNEGSIWEGALAAAQHRLDNLTVLIDYNRQQSFASTDDVVGLEPFDAKWKSFGWGVTSIDGHDVNALRTTLQQLPLVAQRPTAIICHTVKGKGIAEIERNFSWHHKTTFTADDAARLTAALDAEQGSATCAKPA